MGAPEPEVNFNIGPGRARDTLEAFAQQSGQNLLYADEGVGNVQTRELRIRTGIEDGLVRLLWQSGLGCRKLDNGDIVIRHLPLLRRSLVRCDRETAHRVPLSQSTARPPSSHPSAVQTHTPLTVIPVTGTYLPGTNETGSFGMTLTETSPLWIGATTVPQVLRRIPENWPGGPSEDTRSVGSEAMSNSGTGISANLRGLGARATLFMLDGRRIAPSGTQGSFVDALQVPLSAVDHFEVVMDGASALYGSDAVGGVINILTRQHFSGSRIFGDAGGNPDGTQHEYRFGYIGGIDWNDRGGVVVTLERYRREGLPADRRALARSDLEPWGPNLGTPYSNPPTLVTNLGTFAVPPGQRNGALDFASLQPGENLSNVYEGAQILPRQTRDSLYTYAHQRLTDSMEGFATLLWAERYVDQYQGGEPVSIVVPANTPFLSGVPANAAPLVLEYNLGDALGSVLTRTKVRTFNAAAGLTIELPRDWRLWTSVSKSLEQESQITLGAGDPSILDNSLAEASRAPPNSDLQSFFNPFNGSPIPSALLGELPTQPWFGSRSQVWQFQAKAAGALWSLPGGDVQGAFGGEYRSQGLQTASAAGSNSPAIGTDLGRTLRAAFGEIRVPVFGRENAQPGLRKLDLSLAARYEHYSDFRSTVTPRFWVIYSPFEKFQLRSSYAWSTRAPNLGDLSERENVSFPRTVSDPQSPLGTSQVLAWAGGNSQLTAEHATSYSAGVHLLPLDTLGFEAELNYFNIAFKDRIQVTGADNVNGVVPDILENPLYQDNVIRAPSTELKQQICSTTLFPGGRDACLQAPVGAVVDLRAQNIATVRTQGLDVSLQLSWPTSAGEFSYSFLGVYLLQYAQRTTPYAAQQNLLNTPHNPINLELSSSVDWTWRGFCAQLTDNFANGYHDPSNLVRPSVRSWMTFGAGLRYEFGTANSSWMSGLAVKLSADDLLNRGPPSLVNRDARLGYDEENGELTGRVLRVSVTKRWPWP